MPITGKETGPSDPGKAANLPFEASLKKLEAIVESMETEDLPLETLLARYEEGTRLAKICQEKLAAAELKIQKLEQRTGGALELKPMTPTSGLTGEE